METGGGPNLWSPSPESSNHRTIQFLFSKLILRHALQHRLVAALNVLTIALGVSVYLAIQIANHSAFRAFRAGIDVVAGKSHLEVRSPEGVIDESLIPILEKAKGVSAATPVCEGYAVLPDYPGEYLRILGIDPFTNFPFQTIPLAVDESGRFLPETWLSQPDRVFLSKALGNSLGLAPGDRFKVQIDGHTVDLTLGFLLKDADDDKGSAAPTRVASMDIGWFQELFGTQGRVTSIQLLLDDPSRLREARESLAELVPDNVTVEPPTRRSAQVQHMIEGFQLNITALSMVSIFVGIFLIYNTVSASVVHRRREIGILRSTGASRGQIRWLFLGEALVMGAAGTALGLVGGVLLSSSLLGQVAETVSTHYILVSIERFFINPWHAAHSVIYGMAAAFFGAWIPAVEATRIEPSRVMHPGRAFQQAPIRKFGYFAVGLVLLGFAGTAAWRSLASGPAWISFLSCFGLIAGFSLMTPLISHGLVGAFGALCQWLEATLQRIAGDNFRRSLHRTATTVAALMAAVAMMIGVSVMISSFRSTIDQWVGRAMVADLYLAPAANEIIGMKAFTPPEIRAHLDTLPIVEETETLLETLVPMPDGQEYTLAIVEGGRRGNIAYVGETSSKTRDFFKPDHLLVSENFAGRFDLEEGDALTLPTPDGDVAFRIAGVFHDYSEDRGRVFITRNNYDRHWREKRYHSVAVYLKPEHRSKAADLADDIREKFGALGEFSIFTNAAIREKIFEVFDQTFAITYVLRTIAIAVAVIGIVLTLTTLTSERAREIGVLRAVGASRSQICSTYLAEASLIGILASTIGIVCGLLLAMILTWVVNRAFFQWTIHFQIPWQEIAWTPLWVTAVAFAAGIFPALRAGSQPIGRAVRSE